LKKISKHHFTLDIMLFMTQKNGICFALAGDDCMHAMNLYLMR